MPFAIDALIQGEQPGAIITGVDASRVTGILLSLFAVGVIIGSIIFGYLGMFLLLFCGYGGSDARALYVKATS